MERFKISYRSSQEAELFYTVHISEIQQYIFAELSFSLLLGLWIFIYLHKNMPNTIWLLCLSIHLTVFSSKNESSFRRIHGFWGAKHRIHTAPKPV